MLIIITYYFKMDDAAAAFSQKHFMQKFTQDVQIEKDIK